MNNKPKRNKSNFNQTKPWSAFPKQPKKRKLPTYYRPERSENSDPEIKINKELILEAVLFCSLASLFYIFIGYLCAPWEWPLGIALLGAILLSRALIWHQIPALIAWSGTWVGCLILVGFWTYEGVVSNLWQQSWKWLIAGGNLIIEFWIFPVIITIILIIGAAEQWIGSILVITGTIKLTKNFIGMIGLSLAGSLIGGALGCWALLVSWAMLKVGVWTVAVFVIIVLISAKTITENEMIAMGVTAAVVIALTVAFLKPDNITGAMVIASAISGSITIPLTMTWFKTINRSWIALLNIFREFQALVLLASISLFSLGIGWLLYRILPALQ